MELKCRECNKGRGMRHLAKCTVRPDRKTVRREDCHEPVSQEETELADKLPPVEERGEFEQLSEEEQDVVNEDITREWERKRGQEMEV